MKTAKMNSFLEGAHTLFPKNMESPEVSEGLVCTAATTASCVPGLGRSRVPGLCLFQVFDADLQLKDLVWEGLGLSVGLWGQCARCSGSYIIVNFEC